MNSADKAMILVRRQVREHDEVALLNRRVYGIVRSMTEDAKECGRLAEIDFSVEELRGASQLLRGTDCKWCGRPLKAKNISWDHEIPIFRGGSYSKDNLAAICSVCNGQKGSLTAEEFKWLRDFIGTLAQEARSDILRRLGLGARWRS